MGKSCVFCGSSNLSKEHIFAQWLLKELGIEKANVTLKHTSFFGYVKSKREHSFLKLVNGNVCVDCNNGWMSSLEAINKQHITNLMNLKNLKPELEWVKENSFILAQRAFKNIILLNNASNFHNLVPDEHFHVLFDGKIPNNVFITLSFCENGEGLEWRQSIGFKIAFNKEKHKPPIKNRRYNITFRINKLMLKVRFIEHDTKVGYDDEDCIMIYPEFGPFTQSKGYMHDTIDSFDLTSTIYLD